MSDNQLAHKLNSNFSSLSDFAVADTQINEFFESVSLVGSSIFGLFSSKGIVEVATEAMTVGTSSDVSKGILLSLYKKLNCQDFLKYLEKVDASGLASISPDFFNPITKHFGRSQSIESYSKLLFLLCKIYGLNMAFIRNFFVISRDAEETSLLIKYVGNWNYNLINIPKDSMIIRIYLSFFDRMAGSQQYEDLIKILPSFPNIMEKEKNQEVITIFNKFSYGTVLALANRKDTIKMKELLNILLRPEYQLNIISINRILDAINKHLLSEELVDLIVNSIESNGLKPNIITYNCYVESFCLLGNLNKVYQIFGQIKANGLQPDSYTFSNFIKGFKGVPMDQFNKVHSEFYRLYKESNCRDKIVINTFIDHCIAVNDDEFVMKVFNDVQSGALTFEADNVTYNIIMKHAIKNRDIGFAKTIISQIIEKKFKPNLSTFNSLLNLIVKNFKSSDLMFFYDCLKQSEVSPDSFTYSIILNGAKTMKMELPLIKEILEDIKIAIKDKNQKIDEVVFNTILEILFSYDLLDQFDFYHSEMKRQNIPESSYTFSVILKKLSKLEDFDKINSLFDEILEKKVTISDFNYGFILDYFAKSGRMDNAMAIYKKLRKNNIELSSIIFTTMIKGFINIEDYKSALEVFNDIKHLTEQPGMIITYNCALDVMINMGGIDNALVLFEEIDKQFKADLISYSIIVKGLCKINQKQKAFDMIKRMINSKIEYDVSIINMFLENCAASEEQKLGVNCFETLMKLKVCFNEITMGIMVKIYGASFKLKNAFELLDFMPKQNLKPSLIFFTNLIHVSFYNKKPAKAELAATLMKNAGIKGDKLMYSKLIEGLLRFKQTERIMTYVQQAITDECTLKVELINQLFEIYEDDAEALELIEKVKYCVRANQNTAEINTKLKNNYHQTNTQNFKNQIWQKNREKQEAEKKIKQTKDDEIRNAENPDKRVFGVTKTEKPAEQNYTKPNSFAKNGNTQYGPKQPMVLHNFRTNKKAE